MDTKITIWVFSVFIIVMVGNIINMSYVQTQCFITSRTIRKDIQYVVRSYGECVASGQKIIEKCSKLIKEKRKNDCYQGIPCPIKGDVYNYIGIDILYHGQIYGYYYVHGFSDLIIYYSHVNSFETRIQAEKFINSIPITVNQTITQLPCYVKEFKNAEPVYKLFDYTVINIITLIMVVCYISSLILRHIANKPPSYESLEV